MMLDVSTLPPPPLTPVILDVPAPDHVPRHLIRDLRLHMGWVPNENLDPYEAVARVFADDVPPVLWSPMPFDNFLDGLWVVTRNRDVAKVYQDSAIFSSVGSAQFQLLVGEDWPSLPLGVDPPEHSRYRRLLNPWFTQKAVAEMEPDIRRLANTMIDDFLAAGGGDFARDYARVFPVRVFLKLMGLPFSMFEQFLEWEHEILHSRDLTRIAAACGATLAYLRSFIAEKEAAPDDTLTSRIVNSNMDGKALDNDEKIGIMFFLWLGGLDTVASTLGQMFRRLALDHGLQQMLRDDPGKIKTVTEEFLRTQPLVNNTRLLTQDYEMHGVLMKKGDRVMCMNMSGNFDPTAFECPHQFDPSRKASRHTTFGTGAHLCLGINLARQELWISLEEWLRRVPMFSIVEGETRQVVPGLLSVKKLPLTW
jgi:cytochrome P450